VKSSPSQPHEFSFLGRRGRFFGFFLAFFSFRAPGTDYDFGKKENSQPFSCLLLFPAPARRFRRRLKGEIFSKILQSSPSGHNAELLEPPEKRILPDKPSFFSFSPPRYDSSTARKENSCAESVKFLPLNLPSLSPGPVVQRILVRRAYPVNGLATKNGFCSLTESGAGFIIPP